MRSSNLIKSCSQTGSHFIFKTWMACRHSVKFLFVQIHFGDSSNLDCLVFSIALGVLHFFGGLCCTRENCGFCYYCCQSKIGQSSAGGGTAGCLMSCSKCSSVITMGLF